ncbi:MAG: transglycosylase SLT domain-containing protein [bacterium]
MSEIDSIAQSVKPVQIETKSSVDIKTDDLEKEKLRLRKASKEFESLFIYQMLKAMRKTVGENSLTKDSPFSGDYGKDTYMDMFDQQLALKMAGGGRSIADALYNSMVKVLDGSINPPENIEIKPLKTENDKPDAIPIEPFKVFPEESTAKPLINIEKIGKLRNGIRLSVDAENTDKIIRDYSHIVDKAAQANQVDSALVFAVIKEESGGDPKAVSPAGAKGLMQLMDSTAEELGTPKVFNPDDNIDSGTRYLKQMLDRFGDTKLALAAYNAGPGNVEKYQGMPPFAETQSYVEKVMESYASYKDLINAENAKGVSHGSR